MKKKYACLYIYFFNHTYLIIWLIEIWKVKMQPKLCQKNQLWNMFWERDWLCEVVFQCCFSLQETFDGLIQSFFPFKRNSTQRNISQELFWNKAMQSNALLFCAWLKYTKSNTQHTTHIHSLCVAADDAEDGIGICGWLLTTLSWLIVLVTLPFSLCVCFKVIPCSHHYSFPRCPTNAHVLDVNFIQQKHV